MENVIESPFEAAKYFKWMDQYRLDYIKDKQPLNKIQCKGFYMKNKEVFDKAFLIFKKYNLDIYNYIDFFINSFNKPQKSIKDDFLSIETMDSYKEYLFQRKHIKNIYNWFEKSVNNIVNDCIERDFFTIKDYIRDLIVHRKLASYYLTGKISRYWFCGIPSFKKIIQKLDPVSKDEFRDMYERFDIYNTDVNKAFLFFKNSKVNPIKITEEKLFQKRSSLNQSK